MTTKVGKLLLKFESQIECFRCKILQRSGSTVYFMKSKTSARVSVWCENCYKTVEQEKLDPELDEDASQVL